MATLEVHDGQGRVQFVELCAIIPSCSGRALPATCVLEGDGIRPVHGRIRWKKPRFRVEASPDAEFVLINGTKMTAGSIHQGDEIAVGSCRIFLLRNDEDLIDVRQSTSAFDRRSRHEVLAAPFVPVESKNDLGHRPVQPKRDTGHQPITPQSEKGHQPRTVLPRINSAGSTGCRQRRWTGESETAAE